MDRKTIFAIVLSIAVLLVYQYFFAKPETSQKQAQAPATEEKAAEKKQEAGQPVKPGILSATPASSAEKVVEVDTELYTATFTSKGGRPLTFFLKKYKDKEGSGISLLSDSSPVPALALGMNDDFSVSSVNFNLKGDGLKLDSGNPTGSIVFEYATEKFSIRRTYTFYADKYKFDLVDEVNGLQEYQIALGADFGLEPPKDRDDQTHVGPVILQGTDRTELTGKSLKEIRSYKGDIKWIALEEKYFFSSLVPLSPVDEARAWRFQDSAIVSFKAKPGINRFLVYAGPKEHNILKELNVGLEHIIDFGFFSIIARPIFWILKELYKIFGNYGWAIVFLTIIVRIPFIPLVNKGQKSMKRLAELQPKMQDIKEKYKKDRERMNKEMMELYKHHKVNPASGCLPLLIQIPVFFALYKVLLIAIELRGAPFMLYIKDLSLKDPYYILPVLMGITMFLQQKLTPATGDPKQQKMMLWFMPVFLTFLFLNLASGLVLYFFVSNLLSIAQQIYVNKKAQA
jgi:YidC/Oxa1 family membrane protein insertase